MAYGRRHSRLPDGPDLFDFADQHNTLSRQSQTSQTPTSEAGQEVKPLISAQKQGQNLCHVAEKLIEITCKSQTQLTQSQVRDAMSMVFGGLDSTGHWLWSQAYDAIEIAKVLLCRKQAKGLTAKSLSKAYTDKADRLHIPQTRRSDDKIDWQQFSTPLYYALAAGLAAQIRTDDLVLEPSAGTGMLTLLPTLMGVKLALNEMEPTRHACLQVMYPELKVTRHNAEYLDDLLDDSVRPSVVLMNPPFSTSPNMPGRRTSSITEMHMTQALKRLSFGGRLVAITGHRRPHLPRLRSYTKSC